MHINKAPRRPNPRDTKQEKDYHTATWRKKRVEILERDGYQCQSCKRSGRLVQANTVDHKKPVKQGGAFLDNNNLEAICPSCHAKKSARERRNAG